MERQEDVNIEPDDALPKEGTDTPEAPQADPDTDRVVEEKQRED